MPQRLTQQSHGSTYVGFEELRYATGSGNGVDFVFLSDIDDSVFFDVGDDLANGGGGNDNLRSGNGNDTLSGNLGDDILSGGSGDDLLLGQEGNDSLRGGLDDDWLLGGANNDTLSGGTGDNTLDGGSGEDRLVVTSGTNTMTGGTGNDDFVFNTDFGTHTITDFQGFLDEIWVSEDVVDGVLSVGALDLDRFAFDTPDSDEGQFVFVGANSDAPTLFWDPDGLGAQDAVEIVSVGAGQFISGFDIVIF